MSTYRDLTNNVIHSVTRLVEDGQTTYTVVVAGESCHMVEAIDRHQGHLTMRAYVGVNAGWYLWHEGNAYTYNPQGDYIYDNMPYSMVWPGAQDLCLATYRGIIDAIQEGWITDLNDGEACTHADDIVGGCWSCRTLIHADEMKAMECPSCGSDNVALLATIRMPLDEFITDEYKPVCWW